MEQLREWDYSAYDALYLGDYSCPRFKDNFASGYRSLKEGLEIVKNSGKKCFLSLYAVPNNSDLQWIEPIIKSAMQLPFDALEVHNLGLLHLLREMQCTIPIHMGVFANLYTHTTTNVLEQYGVERIYPNPELSLKEIEHIKDQTQIEVMVPVHGKIPLVISETCFIMENSGKDSDQCKFECCSNHWLNRENGEWILKDIGRLTMSGKDLCMIREIDTLREKGLDYFYIQSMREDKEYVSEVGKLYKQALDLATNKTATGHLLQQWEEILDNYAMQGLCNGYYFGTTGQQYTGNP